MLGPQQDIQKKKEREVEISVSKKVAAAKEIYEREWFIVLLIFGFSLFIKGIYLFFLASSPTFDAPTLDASTHLRWAEQLVSNCFSEPHEFFRAPIYPYFLAGLLAVVLGFALCAICLLYK